MAKFMVNPGVQSSGTDGSALKMQKYMTMRFNELYHVLMGE